MYSSTQTERRKALREKLSANPLKLGVIKSAQYSAPKNAAAHAKKARITLNQAPIKSSIINHPF